MSTQKHTVSQSRATATYIVLPGDTNNHGTIFGGKVMQWIDIAASIAVNRHCRMPAVTSSIDELHFLHPILLGYLVNISAEVTYTGRTSMEVEAVVKAENPTTGEKQITSVAYLTFVALDRKTGKPVKVPPIVPETPEEVERYADAKKRKESRVNAAGNLKALLERHASEK